MDTSIYNINRSDPNADRFQLEVLELATKTPSKFRSPLQQRCVQQLQRGMVVSLKDALRPQQRWGNRIVNG